MAEIATSATRDVTWHRERRREIVRGVAERERHSLTANLVGWLICAITAFYLPNPEAFILPLALRLGAIALTRVFAIQLRADLAAGRELDRGIFRVSISLAFAGFTWAFLLWPLFHMTPAPTAAIAIVAVTITAISLITGMLGPLKIQLAAFCLIFASTASLGMLTAPEPVTIWVPVALVTMLAGSISFSLGAAQHQLDAATMLVENRCLGDELSSALASAEFLSLHDPLTGLLNRRAIFEDPASCRTQRHLLAIDLDHFKTINDRFGHATGDRVLVATAGVLRDAVAHLPGEGHAAVRVGGEEFLVLLATEDAAIALSVAEAIRRRLERMGAGIEPETLCVSASIGLATQRPGEPIDAAYSRADASLYRAKEAGRNRVMRAAA